MEKIKINLFDFFAFFIPGMYFSILLLFKYFDFKSINDVLFLFLTFTKNLNVYSSFFLVVIIFLEGLLVYSISNYFFKFFNSLWNKAFGKIEMDENSELLNGESIEIKFGSHFKGKSTKFILLRHYSEHPPFYWTVIL